MRPNPRSVEFDGDALAEETLSPHEPADHDVELVARPANLSDEMKRRAVQRIRITKNDLMRYGYSDDCPKCQDLRKNQIFTGKHHSEMCRYRLYAEFQKRQRY